MKSLFALIFLATPATADEYWALSGGQAYYDVDIGSTAVFSVTQGQEVSRYYIADLVGRGLNRSENSGYWMLPGAGPCDATLITPDGFESTNYGPLVIQFTQQAPYGWTAYLGDCFGTPYREVVAQGMG